MTARKPPRPDGLNVEGTGRGLNKHTRPVTKKHGVNVTETPERALAVRSTFLNTSTNAAAESVSPDKPLTEKQRAFVKFWAQGESITSASIKAGYNDGASIAYRMSKMPNVLRIYNEEKRLYEEASQMTRKKVMDGLLEAVEMAKMLAEPATMVAGWREIGKMAGYYAPVEKKLTLDVTGGALAQRMAQLSDAELLKMIEAQFDEASTEDE